MIDLTALAASHTDPPLVRVWDLNFTLLATIENGWRLDEPETLTQPVDAPLSQWLLSDMRRGEVFLTADHDGKRWIGRQRVLELLKAPFADGQVKYVKCTFQDDTGYMAEKLAKVKGLQ